MIFSKNVLCELTSLITSLGAIAVVIVATAVFVVVKMLFNQTSWSLLGNQTYSERPCFPLCGAPPRTDGVCWDRNIWLVAYRHTTVAFFTTGGSRGGTGLYISVC